MTRAILHLGGNVDRARTTAQVAADHLGAEVIIGSESNPTAVLGFLAARHIAPSRITFDYHAWDTVTNFTHILPLLRELRVRELYIVGWVSPRPLWVARLVYLGRGIRCHYVPHLVEPYRDPWLRIVKDVVRAAVWRVTGVLLAERRIKAERAASLASYYDEALALQCTWTNLEVRG